MEATGRVGGKTLRELPGAGAHAVTFARGLLGSHT
jgi:hypothetical protein